MSSQFYSPDNYIINPNPIFHDDTGLKDEYQDKVYKAAFHIYDNNCFGKIVDLGCGSAFKLLKYFGHLALGSVIGIDKKSTVDWLRGKYKQGNWRTVEEGPINCDFLICADMIEHVLDPDTVLTFISNCNPQYIVLSTPDRGRLYNNGIGVGNSIQNGPPNNPSHVREWSFDEFAAYIGTQFNILTHEIVDKDQCTQMIVAKLL